MSHRPLLALALAAAAGILAQRFDLAALFWPAAALLGMGAAWCLGRRRRLPALLLGAAALAGAAGFLLGHRDAATRRAQAAALARLDRGRLRLTVAEASVVPAGAGAAFDPERYRLIARVEAAAEPSRGLPVDLAGARVRLYPGADPRDWGFALRAGDSLEADVVPNATAPPAFPGAFSRPSYYQRLDICGTAQAYDLRRVDAAPWWRPSTALAELRAWLISGTLRHAPDLRGALLAAVLFGYREAVPQEVRGLFRRTGAGHLLAVSGLHVGLVTGLAWLLLRSAGAGPRGAAAGAIAVCLLYLGLSGGRPSAVRAGVMATLYLGGFLVFRRSDLLNALGAAALVILLHHPPAITDAGFLLSFTAVVFLSRLSHESRLLRFWERPAPEPAAPEPTPRLRPGALLRRGGARAWGLFLLGGSAWLGLWPLAAHYFHLLAFTGPVLNVLAVPWLSVVLGAGLLLPLAGLLPSAWAAVWAGLCAWPAEVLLRLVETTAREAPLVLPVHPPAGWAMALYYGAFALFFGRRWLRVPTGAALGAIGVAGLLTVGTMREAPAPPQTRLTVFPAGWGDCCVVETPDGKAAVIGHLPRGGLDAVDYLRGCRRGRLAAVVRIPPPFGQDDGELAVLREQYGTPAFVRTLPRRLAAADGADGEASGGVFGRAGGRLPGLTGVRLELIRRANGRLLAWRVRCGETAVLVTESVYAGELAHALAARPDGAAASLQVLRLRDREWPAPLAVRRRRLVWRRWRGRDEAAHDGSARVAVRARRGVSVPVPYRDRRACGALRLCIADEPSPRPAGSRPVTVWDGGRWRTWRQARPPAGASARPEAY
jgi:competence protein ComEC